MAVARRRRGRGIVAVALASILLAGCGDDGPVEPDAADEASFCRLATQNAPLAEASPAVLARLADLAPSEVDASVAVLRDLAERLAELDADDPASLALEFEVRFGDEHVAARRAVDAYVALECASTTSSSTTTTVDGARPTTTTTGDGA